jgi:hypothetical protein
MARLGEAGQGKAALTLANNGPIEVWLSQKNLEVTCTVVHETKRTDTLNVKSLSMRGAQREITGYLIKQGYQPVDRWSSETTDSGAMRTNRRFKARQETS